MSALVSATLTLPFGPIVLVADETALVALECGDTLSSRHDELPSAEESEHPVLRAAARQLQDYFAGKRRTFDVPLAPRGTPFQREVWSALAKVPFAELVSYGDLARRIGRPTAFRAVAGAVGDNPIAIIIPCQRVVGSQGHMTGFASGLGLKKFLLEHEGMTVVPGTRADRDKVLPHPIAPSGTGQGLLDHKKVHA